MRRSVVCLPARVEATRSLVRCVDGGVAKLPGGGRRQPGITGDPVFATFACKQTTAAPTKAIEELYLPRDDVLRVQGSVIETLPNAMFSVQIDGGLKVLARASGKMRRGRFIRILPGDRVDVELSAYDPSRGRIVWRYK